MLLKEKLIAIHNSPGNKRHGLPHKTTWRSAIFGQEAEEEQGESVGLHPLLCFLWGSKAGQGKG